MKQKDKAELENIKAELISIKTRLSILHQKEYNNLLNISNSFEEQQNRAITNEVLLKESMEFIDDIVEQLSDVE